MFAAFAELDIIDPMAPLMSSVTYIALTRDVLAGVSNQRLKLDLPLLFTTLITSSRITKAV